MASNAEWGLLAEHDDEAAELWDSYSRLPEPGEDPILDAFCARKGISIEGLVRLGARDAGDGVIAFAYPGGLKYRNLVNGDKWSRADSEWKQLKVVRAGTEPSREVIVVEGETDAARLTMAYGVDVAVLPAGARTVKPAYLEQLREYDVVLVGTDDDEAGDAGAEKILAAVPQAIRFAPPHNDWCDTEDDELPELPADVEPRPPLNFTPLGEIVAAHIEPAVVLYDGVLIAEAVNLFSGHPGHGKTTIVQHQTFKAMQEGRHVVWFDWENGVRSYARRLQAIALGAGLSREQAAAVVKDRLHYAPFEHLPPDEDGRAILEATVEFYPEPPLIVMDSMSKALLHAGYDEDSNSEATQWFAHLTTPIRELGATIIVIDHVAKSATRSTGYSRGAGAKAADVDSHWYVETTEPFNRDTPGKLLLTNQKDREGVLAHRLAFKVGDGQGALPLTPTVVDVDDEEDEDAPSI